MDEETVLKFLQNLKNSSPGFDNLSISFIKICCPLILPFIVNIFNTILLDSKFPTSWKHAQVTPIPKNRSPQQLSDLRPISILSGLSKLFEKIMADQLAEYLEKNSILPGVQSGFRPGYSSTGVLLGVTDDILRSLDDSKCVALFLLDFSRAFDTVKHDILLAVLGSCGVRENALRLFESYLAGRSQSVKLGGKTSRPRNILDGVPQGSILGPLLFLVYTSQFITFIQYCRVLMYADDFQLYYDFTIDDLDDAALKMNEDLNRLADIAARHALKLNAKKSSALVFGSNKNKQIIKDRYKPTINNDGIQFVDNARDLGLIIDDSLRFREHVVSVVRRAYGALRLLYPHRSCLPVHTKRVLCESLVLSQFTYCSPVYSFCLDKETLDRIQRVQNSCIRFIYRIKKYDHVSHKLGELGWLPMRISFKFFSLCAFHNIILKRSPPYLFNRLVYRTDVHNINIRRRNILSCPRHRTSTFKRSFSYNICKLYNGVPDHLKLLNQNMFKKKVKTYLLDPASV